jgi:5-methylcytosine-specific restriction endonuclease McrA
VKSVRVKLRKNLDKLVKDYVKNRDRFTCQKCGEVVSGSNCHASHVIPVSAGMALAYDPINLKVLCYHHHINWWHKNPMESAAWFAQKFPDRWEYLQKKKMEPKLSIKDWQLEELYTKLASELSLKK